MPKKRGRKYQILKNKKMKNLFLGLIATAFVSFSLSSFTTKDSAELSTCTYNVYNASGQYLGQITIDVLDSMPCGSASTKQLAIDIWNIRHGD